MSRVWLPLIACLACSACDREVDSPFYISTAPDDGRYALIRCVGDQGDLCADVEGIGPGIVAAGANKQFVVVAQQRDGSKAYYYFKRVPQEKSGWGNNPERIVGPLTEALFAGGKSVLHLPDFSVEPWFS